MKCYGIVVDIYFQLINGIFFRLSSKKLLQPVV